MNIIIWIIFGALAGWVASMIVKTNAQQGIIVNILVGIVGAFVGGYLMQIIGKTGVTGFNVRSFIVAVMGSVILLFVYRAVSRRA